MAEILKQLEQFIVGGSFVAGFLFTKRMHGVYREKIAKIEEDYGKIIGELHKIDKEVMRLSTKLDYMKKNKGE